MPQLHLYLPEELARQVRRQAEVQGLSVSAYLAQLVRAQLQDDWPPDYFSQVFGSWVGELERPPDLPEEDREPLI